MLRVNRKLLLFACTLSLISTGCGKRVESEPQKIVVAPPVSTLRQAPSGTTVKGPGIQGPVIKKIDPPAVALPIPTEPKGPIKVIPQDPQQQQQQYADRLAWNRKTTVGAYDKIGKQDAKWDKSAREALDAAARHFSEVLYPSVTQEEVHAIARKAIEAGCNDPLVLYIYGRTSTGPNFPGDEEYERRLMTAARAMEGSTYPYFRRCVALQVAAECKCDRKNLSPEDRKEAVRMYESGVTMILKSAEEDKRDPQVEKIWREEPQKAAAGLSRLTETSLLNSWERIEPILAKSKTLEPQRLHARGRILMLAAWDARGNGYASTVTEEGARLFRERLLAAGEALEKSWKLRPVADTAMYQITVGKGLGYSREETKKWFDRAMKADGNCYGACFAMMEWLDPKWHGTPEDLLAFGQACRETKNWRAGIPLLAADAHCRLFIRLPGPQQDAYLAPPAVRDEITAVYEEYLRHHPKDNAKRSIYAGYCYLFRRFPAADMHFRVVGDNLTGNEYFSESWLKSARDQVSAIMPKQTPNPKK